MSHACRGIGAFAHAIVLGSRNVLNRTSPATAAALLLASAVSAAAPGVVFAQGNGPIKVETPLLEPVGNPCTGETVMVTGTTDLFLYTKVKKSGGIDITVRIKQHGSGTSTAADGSTAYYNFHSEETTKMPDVPPGAFETALLSKTMLVRQGELGDHSQDDWMMKHTVRIKIDEFGNVIMNRDKITDSCPAN
jgi:hypothetical protein